LLILAICTLLWLALADPERETGEQVGFHVLYLDGSAYTSNIEDFERAKDLLLADLANLPEHQREVYLGAARTLKILNKGEHHSIAGRRLQDIQPDGSVSPLSDFLRLLGTTDQIPNGTRLVVYGNVMLDDTVFASLPKNMSIVQQPITTEESVNWGITSLGWSPSSTGSVEMVDVLVEFASSSKVSLDPPTLTILVNGEALSKDSWIETAVQSYLIPGVRADGSLLTATLDVEDRFTVDNSARLRLPLKRLIPVFVDSEIDSSLYKVIASDPGIVIVQSGEQVRVEQGTADAPSSNPVLRVVPNRALDSMVTFGIPARYDDASKLRSASLGLGMDQIETAKHDGAERERFLIGFETTEVRTLTIEDGLLSKDIAFTNSSAFPVFIAKAIRWLGDESAQYAFVAAGQPLVVGNDLDSLAVSNELASALLGSEFIPVRPTSEATAPSATLAVSLLDSGITELIGTVGEQPQSDQLPQSRSDIWGNIGPWLVGLAILLLALEWFLYQRRLIP